MQGAPHHPVGIIDPYNLDGHDLETAFLPHFASDCAGGLVAHVGPATRHAPPLVDALLDQENLPSANHGASNIHLGRRISWLRPKVLDQGIQRQPRVAMHDLASDLCEPLVALPVILRLAVGQSGLAECLDLPGPGQPVWRSSGRSQSAFSFEDYHLAVIQTGEGASVARPADARAKVHGHDNLGLYGASRFRCLFRGHHVFAADR